MIAWLISLLISLGLITGTTTDASGNIVPETVDGASIENVEVTIDGGKTIIVGDYFIK